MQELGVGVVSIREHRVPSQSSMKTSLVPVFEPKAVLAGCEGQC